MPLDATNETAEFCAACIHNPLGFVRGAFAWGATDLADESGPDQWQTELLTELGRMSASGDPVRFAVASGHGVGKTALVSWVILWAMLTRPNLAGVVTANTQNQLSGKTWAELSRWRERLIPPLRAMLEWTATKIRHNDAPERWFLEAVPWSERNSEAFAGLHADHVLVLYDEASAIPDVIWDVSEGAMTTPRAMWLAFGNPTRTSGRFAECWGRMRHRWRTWTVDSRTAKKADQKQIARWIEDYGLDSDFVRVRVLGQQPRAAASQFIGRDIVQAAQLREPVTIRTLPLVLGVDVARFGDDQTVLLFRRGQMIERIVRYRGLDTMQTAARVAEAMDEFKPDGVTIDGVGVGGGVVDRLRQMGRRVIDVNVGATAIDDKAFMNVRAEIWSKMRDWLKAGGCIPADDRELADDLAGPEYFFDAKQRLALEKKADMKARGLASPDAGDALALTFASTIVRDKDRAPLDLSKLRRSVI